VCACVCVCLCVCVCVCVCVWCGVCVCACMCVYVCDCVCVSCVSASSQLPPDATPSDWPNHVCVCVCVCVLRERERERERERILVRTRLQASRAGICDSAESRGLRAKPGLSELCCILNFEFLCF
jgi:hypothetical protein